MASKLRAEVDIRRLPLSPAVEAAGERGLRWALSGGEDYELLLAVPPSRAVAFEAACAKAGEKVIRGIGFRTDPSLNAIQVLQVESARGGNVRIPND